MVITANEINTRINDQIDAFNARLDQVEQDLPAMPAAALRLNRAVTDRIIGSTTRAGGIVVDVLENVSEQATKTYKSVAKNAPDFDGLVSSASRFAEDTVDFATTGAKTVAGQFGLAFDKAETEVVKSVRTTAKKVEKSEAKAEKVDLSKKTKAELYEIAKDMDLDGRATMSKGELVKAIAKNS